ncbi:hypothetical protein [Pseudonocardia sp. GCM10023141]|uniref:hypothetical protein n=1 Tax=Pseudonocardia sp. GCM10023141 TaxID=3252653 RepID=UPI0036151324
MAATDPEEKVRALARTLERQAGKVEALEKLVRQLATDITHRAQANPDADPAPITAPAPAPAVAGEGTAAPAAMVSWLLVEDPASAVAAVAALIEWVDRVYLRYPDAHLSTCWLWHPEVVEELWWLRGAHLDAYDPKFGSWLRVGDWHDRQRPGVIRRIAKVVMCELMLHQPGQRESHPPLTAPLAAFGNEVATAWATNGNRAPEPNLIQLVEAKAYFLAVLGRH